MGECLLVALLVGGAWMVLNAMLELPLGVGVAGVVCFFIVALWLGALLDSTEYEEDGE